MKLAVFMNHIEAAAQQREIPLDAMLEQCAAWGLSGVEQDACESVHEGRALAQRLLRFGLNVANVDVHLDLAHNSDGIEHGLDVVASMGATKCLVIPGFVNGGEDVQRVTEHLMVGLQKTCDSARQRGLTVTIEDYDGASAPYATMAQVKHLLDSVPSLRLTFDTGNFMFSEEDELAAFELLKERIAHVHCKDRTTDSAKGGGTLLTVGGRTLYPVAVGHGCVRIGEIISRLQTLPYDDTLTIEHFDSTDQYEDIRLSVEYLRKTLAI